jgi:5-amino-6-(5-phosphoribosylamino)uracil reductase
VAEGIRSPPVQEVHALSGPFDAQFLDFIARKTREATTAVLPPYVSVAVDPADRMQSIGNAWSRSLFDGDFFLSPPPSALPACSLVFVQSRDGNTGAANPSTLGGGATDKHLIYEGLSRVAADGVLAGAGTIRSGNLILSVWHADLVSLRHSLGKPRHPVQIVATVTGLDLERAMLFNLPDVPVVLLTVASCATLMHSALAARPWITVLAMDRPADLPEAFARLRALGVNRISAIGGRNLAGQLIDLGLVDDLYLTTAARDGGEPGTPLYPQPLDAKLVLRKRGTGPESGVVFEHLTLRDNRN